MDKNPELNARRRERRRNDPEHRERINEYSREYRARQAEDSDYRAKRREYTRKYREENPHMAFYTTSRYQAKKDGAYSDLTPGDALDIHLTPNVCAYCGKDHGDNPPKRAVHIDHIIPMKQGGPNSRWNLTKVCNGCNASKETESLISFRKRTPAFTQERFDAVVAEMAQRSGKSIARITQLIEQSHAFELAFQAERDLMLAMMDDIPRLVAA